MKSSLRNAPVICLLLLCATSTFGQTEQDLEERYGKPIKVYQVSNSVCMIPEYADDGQVRAMTLYYIPVSVDGDRNGVIRIRPLPWSELEKVLDNLVPNSERGKFRDAHDSTVPVRSRTYNYENVTIDFISFLKEEDEKDETVDIDLQVREIENSGQQKQSQVGDNAYSTKPVVGISDAFSNGIARSVEFVQIFWIKRNPAKK